MTRFRDHKPGAVAYRNRPHVRTCVGGDGRCPLRPLPGSELCGAHDPRATADQQRAADEELERLGYADGARRGRRWR